MKYQKKLDIDIRKIIKGFTLFSPELTGVFREKEYTIYTLKALSILPEITEEMEREMRIDVEESRNTPDKKRGTKMDVLVHFPKKKINIEIQKLRNGDEFNRALFYASQLATEIRKGVKKIPSRTIISVWICDFNPAKHLGLDLPYYIFESQYRREEGIEGVDGIFPMGNGTRYVFVNGRYDWERLERRRPLTEKEKRLRTYVSDMKKTDPEDIECPITRDVLYSYKEGDMYNKVEINFRRQYKDIIDGIKAQEREQSFSEGEARGISRGISLGRKEGFNLGRNEGAALEKIATAKAMLKRNFDISTISEITGLDKNEKAKLKG